jgi:tetratricopeptide (TPR) repeat protein
VVQLKPDYANAWFNRAEIHVENGRLAEGIRDYSQVLKLKSQDAVAYRQRGRALARLGKKRQALDDFDRALELNPRDAVALVERGEMYASLSDWEAAVSDFRAAIEVDPDCAEAYRGAAWLMATCPQVKYRSTQAALESAQQAVDLAQAQGRLDFTYYDTLAAALANASRFTDAQRMAQKGIAQAPLGDAANLKKRLTLYTHGRPFRDGAASTAQPASFETER